MDFLNEVTKKYDECVVALGRASSNIDTLIMILDHLEEENNGLLNENDKEQIERIRKRNNLLFREPVSET